MAYCLLGIFDVMIPLLYGEGIRAAFDRLQESIMKKSRDDSILAWSLGPVKENADASAVLSISGGVLATSPAAFERCHNIVKRSQTSIYVKSPQILGGSMSISITLSNTENSSSEPLYGFLSCGPEEQPDHVVAITLARCPAHRESTGGPPIFLRPRGLNAVLMAKTTSRNF
jgi:hypothetical protein